MNVFTLTGDISHVLAFIILLLKIRKTRSCAGISGRSQILFALVYTTRYLDLLSNFISPYNFAMKVFFIGASYTTLYLTYFKFKATYDRHHDIFPIQLLVILAVFLALAFNWDYSILTMLWTFSISLESVAVLPQLYMASMTRETETVTSDYLFCLGSYRGLYILNWIYRYYSGGFDKLFVITAGVVQTVLFFYSGFFYLYIAQKIPDVITCFVCGLRIRDRMRDLDLINEYKKNLPACAFFKTLKEARQTLESKKIASTGLKLSEINLRDCLSEEIIEEGLKYFTESTLKEISCLYLRNCGKKIPTFSLLCNEAIKLIKEKRNVNHETLDLYHFTEEEIYYFYTTAFNMIKNDVLLCTICMTRNIEVLFQPCGHVVSCYACAIRISYCPFCRKFIYGIIRAYHS